MTMGDPRLWDPAAGHPTAAPTIAADTMLFCSGHSFMADGRLMVSGGHKPDDRGLDVTNFFNPCTETWAPVPRWRTGRWYPTVTELPNGTHGHRGGDKDTTKTRGARTGDLGGSVGCEAGCPGQARASVLSA